MPSPVLGSGLETCAPHTAGRQTRADRPDPPCLALPGRGLVWSVLTGSTQERGTGPRTVRPVEAVDQLGQTSEKKDTLSTFIFTLGES